MVPKHCVIRWLILAIICQNNYLTRDWTSIPRGGLDHNPPIGMAILQVLGVFLTSCNLHSEIQKSPSLAGPIGQK